MQVDTFREHKFWCSHCEAKVPMWRWLSDATEPTCPQCHGGVEPYGGQDQRGPFVRPDTIDLMVPHGVCYEDGTPRHFTSRTELRDALKAAGLVNVVRHVPEKGSDKSKWTTRWAEPPQVLTPEDEAARVRHWHEHNRALRDQGGPAIDCDCEICA